MGEAVDRWSVHDGITLCGLKIRNWSAHLFSDAKGFTTTTGPFRF
ncbi:hypothetical protein BTB1458_2227 [Mycobacterium tuberculosis]|nr:Uncharacterized protein BCGR_2197 [Mycobacterium tuberculosis variant bovis BCG]AOZ43226.1 hypothetical protein BTB1458_2227 [Mycobacterium tuberculosis]BAW13014.1 hypothetical protein NCGM946K2_2233 [Mycobacterium tuberculosis]